MARLISTDKLNEKLSMHIKQNYGSLATAAKCWNLSNAAVSYYTRGARPIPDFVLEEMGYERITVYRKIKK